MTPGLRRTLPLAGIAALVALVGVPVLASADPQPTGGTTEATPPSAVEDFSYPNADQIQREKGIKLIRGDGHITLAACDSASSQIRVQTVQGSDGSSQGTYCFKVTAKSGYLDLELPRIFALETADHPISADLKPQDDPSAPTKTVAVAKNSFQSVGEGVAGGTPAVLLKLRVTG
ncbi:hypothetical protein [Streptomyces acidiscabies]|uniref:Secreted protein n=1 Tax=Streptomyces acidiscabies TaxID=42234 RepID=A0ABU4LSD6_9ACTN|nr:hypothetical protein [Streptomyces acidiscabies]MDX3018466.1 hypothetical protein [Streptomyces acidiscabies]